MRRTNRSGRATRLVAALAMAVASSGTFAFDEAATGAAATTSYDFEDGMQGWTVEDGDDSLDTWVHTDEADGSEGALALSSYSNNSQTTVVSPVLDIAQDSILEFRASYWTEHCDCDTVELTVRQPGGQWQTLDRIWGRGRWPLWDPHRYRIPVSGSAQIALSFASDVGCHGGPVKSSQYEMQINATNCGEGFWFDDVLVTPRANLGTDLPAAWGDGPAAHPVVQPPYGTDATWIARDPARAAHSPASHLLANESRDQASNPDFLETMRARSGAIHMDDWWRDPLVDWEGTLGRSLDTWFLNRYETPLGVRLYAPLDDEAHPLLLFIGAYGRGASSEYDSMIRRLVQEGYVVASLAPQGDGHYSSLRSAVLPAPKYCGSLDETAGRWWRQPQEAGLIEEQPCAGIHGPSGGTTPEEIADGYRHGSGPAYVMSTIDALYWALSTDNPWRERIDEKARVGTFGNSAGAWAALVAAQVDDRIGAAAMLDGYGTLDGITPTTPTLTFAYDQYGTSGDLPINPVSVANDLRSAGIDSAFLHSLDTGHLDSTWSPFVTGEVAIGAVYTATYGDNVKNPYAKPIHQNYLLAWFDGHLKGDGSAPARLSASTFDDSADRTAQGTGRWVAGTGNVPYRIEGRLVADHLNDSMTSWLFLHGIETVLAG